jgi:glycine cleavage system transcriptional repressor
MKKWFMVTLVGKDQPGIVSKLTGALFVKDCNLGEASMARLGGNFTIMLMVQFAGLEEELDRILRPICESMDLRCHVDTIVGELHKHVDPDVRISVHGADRAGIVAKVTEALAEAGLNILNLESDIGGFADSPIYIMHIEGIATNGIEALQDALKLLANEIDVETKIYPVDTLLG